MQGRRPGGPAPIYTDPAQRGALMSLFEDGFPGLPGSIVDAERAGFHWDAVTEPFVAHDDAGLVAHVGVLEHRVRLMGRERLVAGVHAVVTRSDARGRGWSRTVQHHALAWADERYDLVKLSTDDPEVYTSQGFAPVAEHRFRVSHTGGRNLGRPLPPSQHAWFVAGCAEREPVSDVFASMDPGWLVGINLHLSRRTLGDLVWLEHLDAVVDWQVVDRELRVHDVFARRLPSLDALMDAAPSHETVLLCVGRDKLAPHATPEPHHSGAFMVRGAWPVPDDVPFCVPRLAEH